MVRFCRDLFGLLDVTDSALLEALRQRVGVSSAGSGIVLDWELLYIQYHVTR